MAGADYDYTRSLLPAGNGSIHAMSGGGYGQPQEGGAPLGSKTIKDTFNFESTIDDIKEVKLLDYSNDTHEIKLRDFLLQKMFLKLASKTIINNLKAKPQKASILTYIINQSTGKDTSYLLHPYILETFNTPLADENKSSSSDVSINNDTDKILRDIFDIIRDKSNPDSKLRSGQFYLTIKFRESTTDKFQPIIHSLVGPSKKKLKKISETQFKEITKDIPFFSSTPPPPPADFEAQAQALINAIPKLDDKVTAIKPEADQYKVDNPGSDAEVDGLVKAVDDSLAAYNAVITKVTDEKAKIAAAAGDAAKKVVVDDMTKIIGGELKTAGDAVEKALAALETKITSASAGVDYGGKAQTIFDEIGPLVTAVETALATLKADQVKLPTDGTQQVLIDKIAAEVPKLEKRITDNKTNNDTLLQGAKDHTEDEDDRKGYVGDLQKRLDDLKAVQTEVAALQAEITTALSGSTKSPTTPVVKSEQKITVLGIQYTLMLPVEASDFDNLDKPGFEALKKLHHDFGLDYIKDGAQKANEKKAEFINNLDSCQTVMTSLKDEKCTKFRGIVSEVITNIVGSDAVAAAAAGATGPPPPPPPPTGFTKEATQLQTEIDTIIINITSLDKELSTKIPNITEATKRDLHNKALSNINTKYQKKYPGVDPIKPLTAKHIADAADPTNGQAAVDALKAIKTDLEGINKELNDLKAKVDADLSTGGTPPTFKEQAKQLQTEIAAVVANIQTLLGKLGPNIQKIKDVKKDTNTFNKREEKVTNILKNLETKYPIKPGADVAIYLTEKHVTDAAASSKGQAAVDALKVVKTDLELVLKQLSDVSNDVDSDLAAGSGGAGREFAAEHAALDAEIETLIKSIEKQYADTETSIQKITDAKIQGALATELGSFDTKWTNFSTPVSGDTLDKLRSNYKTDALGGEKAKAEAAITALTAIRDQLKGFDINIKDIAAKVPKAVHVGGGVKKGIVNFSGSACYFNGIIQMLNQIPEFVQAITAFEPSKFEPTKDAEKELGFFDDDYITKEEKNIAKDQALIDKITNDNKNPSTLIFDIDDRKKIKTLKDQLKTIREQLAKKYKTDITGKSKDEIKTITENYIKIKNDPNSQPPENKEIADIYISLDAKKNEVDTSEKEASTKYPQKWRDSSTGKISEATINVLRENLSKKITALTKLKAFKTSGGKIDFSKFITPLEALKNIFVALNKDDGNKTVDIRDFNKILLNYKPEKFFVNEAGSLKQEDAKDLLNELIFDLLQKDKTLNNIFSKLVFKYKDKYICETDPNQEIRTIKYMLENSSAESDYQITSLLFIALPFLDDGTIDKAPISIQERINKEMLPEKDVELPGCDEFPLNTGEKQLLIEVPDENKYVLINFKREFYDSVADRQGVSNKEIEIEYEITIDSKKYIAIGSVIYSGRASSGHYMFQSFKQSGDKAIPYWQFDDGTSVFEITGSNPTAYNVKAQGLLFLYKRKDAMTGGKRRLGLRGRTLRTSRTAPEQSTTKRTLKARVAATTVQVSTPGPAQTKRRHLKGRTTQSRTERSRVSGRLPIRRAAGK